MTSMTPARTTSTGLPRRLGAVAVAVALLYLGEAPVAQPLLHGICLTAAFTAAAIALADQAQWHRALAVLGRGSGRHRARGRRVLDRDQTPRLPLPRPRTAATSTVDSAAQGGTR